MLTCLVALGGGARSSSAQVLSGVVRDSVSGQPVGRGFVLLLDSTGATLGRSLTGARGEFTFVLRSPGRYRLQSRRIGYSQWTSPWVRVEATDSARVELRISAIPVRLDEIAVERRSRCRVNPREGEATAALWEEASKALEAASWSAEHELFVHTIHNYRRDLDRRRRIVEAETVTVSTGNYTTPFRSLPAEELERDGYIIDRPDGVWYYAPDAEVLRSDVFLSDHCFRVVRDEDRPGDIGLAFEPEPGHDPPGVKGVLWLDQRTARLRSIEYQYTHLPRRLTDRRVGGTIEFLPMPSGAWIVSRWQIRTPRVTRNRSARGIDAEDVYEVGGFRDTGGQITEIRNFAGDVLYTSPDLAVLEGTVFDSTRNAPLRNAVVEVVGTGYTTRTGALGRFSLRALLEGEYRVSFSHPRADSLAVRPEPALARMTRGGRDSVRLWIPSERTILTRLCPDGGDRSDRRVIVGVVRHQRRGAGIPGVPVEARWQRIGMAGGTSGQISVRGQEIEVTTDDQGRYTVCDVPVGRSVSLRTTSASGKMSLARVRFEPGAVLVSSGLGDPNAYVSHYLDGRLASVDLVLMPAACFHERVVNGITEVEVTCRIP